MNKKLNKKCCQCHITKPRIEFCGSDYTLRVKCKTCRNKGKIIYYIDAEKKECCICREIKFLIEFPKQLNSYRYAYCNECFKRTQPIEQQELYKIKWKQRNRYYKKACRKRVRKRLLEGAQKRAKERNLPIDIDISDIIIPEYCPVLGIKIKRPNIKRKESSASVDRINSKMGYTKDNVRIISWRANRIKSNATLIEIEKIAYYMKENVVEDYCI